MPQHIPAHARTFVTPLCLHRLVWQALSDLDKLRTKAAAKRQRRASPTDNIEDTQPASAPAWKHAPSRIIEG
jgi:hypothetical protein